MHRTKPVLWPLAGSTQNLSAQLFRFTSQIDVAVVTYRTTPELLTALLRGDVDVGFDYYPGFDAAIADHRLVAIATTGERPSLSNAPTVHDSLPDYVVTGWNALAGPAGIPDDVVAKLNREINAVLALPDVQAPTQSIRHERPWHHAGGNARANAARHREMGGGDREGGD